MKQIWRNICLKLHKVSETKHSLLVAMASEDQRWTKSGICTLRRQTPCVFADAESKNFLCRWRQRRRHIFSSNMPICYYRIPILRSQGRVGVEYFYDLQRKSGCGAKLFVAVAGADAESKKWDSIHLWRLYGSLTKSNDIFFFSYCTSKYLHYFVTGCHVKSSITMRHCWQC